MASRPTTYGRDSSEAPLAAYAPARARAASWQDLLPTHRRPVLAKTPLLVAFGAYIAGGSFTTRPVLVTMALATLLWAALYALNESTDLRLEEGIPIDFRIQMLVYLLPPVICLAALCLSGRLALLFVLMTAGQVAYCVPPLRLKRWWWAILALSGALNPILRGECGALWGTHAIPPLAYVTVVCLHVGAGIRARTLLKERDQRLHYRIAPNGLEAVGMACTGFGLYGVYRLCLQGVLPRLFLLFILLAALFSVFAWSGRVQSMARLRQGWFGFAILSLLALLALLMQR